MKQLKLFMAILGCRPAGRHTEQHDIFFGIATEMKELIPAMYEYWPEANKKIHVDAWREVNQVDGFEIKIVSVGEKKAPGDTKLFFINLGGYKPGEFEEYHYKMLVAAPNKGEAIMASKKTAFFKHTGFKGAQSHVDDKYGVDVDDLYEIPDILPEEIKKQYSIQLFKAAVAKEDELNIGYFPLSKL
ncbi:MAG: DUF1543 domain-containing protein [Ferruginibacter sp.]